MDFSPVIFSDGEQFFNDLSRTYKQHDRGLFILAPSGAGKTHFCNNQVEKNWIDGDMLWEASGAHPPVQWWLGGEAIIHRVDQRSDVVTMEAKRKGFWIMGASNYWLRPDAVVIPDWETHVSYIKDREMHHYDGGAKSDALDQVKSHIAFIKKWNDEHNVPLFHSIDEAVNALAGSGLSSTTGQET